MDCDMCWSVVQFEEDGSVEAVPTSWIQGDRCYWPPYKSDKMVNAIKKCEALNTHWPSHNIKMFRNATFDSYSKARSKARFAEDCSASDLISDQESGKRRRVKKILSSSSSSDESLDVNFRIPIPKAPQIPKVVEAKRQESLVDNSESQASAVFSPSTTVKASLKGNCCMRQEHQILTELKNQNHLIRGMLVDVLNEVKEIKKNAQNTASIISPTKSLFTKYEIQFPISCENKLTEFEGILKEEGNFDEAVIELSRFGGSNCYDFIKRTMSSLVVDTILMKYSWLGRKGKKRFESMLVAKLIVCAAEKSGLEKSRKEVERAIQSFIKRSSERLMAI